MVATHTKPASTDDRLSRFTAFGVVHGVDDSAHSGTLFWKGIPFAKPPVGALRWKAPVDPEPWIAPLATHTFGNAPIQYGRIYGPGSNNTHDASIAATLNTAVGSEDCLTLNIWRPASDGCDLPVIFYIFGGSNVSGYSADPLYDGAHLARVANAVVVTINYRVGIFGWLNLPQLQCGVHALDDSGNFGTLDTIKALQFVHQNIRSFGGNPDNVSLMGQSAGAVNVYALMTSPLVVNAEAPLFHRAITLSGGISLATNLPAGCIPTLSPVATALGQAQVLLTQLLIADGLATDAASAAEYLATQTKQAVAAYMRSKDANTLFHILMTQLASKGLATSGPIPEGTVVAPDPIAAIRAGDYMKVPVLAGNTRDEAKLFPSFLALFPALGGVPGLTLSDASRFEAMCRFDPDVLPPLQTVEDLIHPSYLPVTAPGTGYNAKTDLLNSLLFLPSRDSVLNALKSQQADIWYYQFNWDQEPAPWNDVYGAAHAFDLPFLFGNFGDSLFGKVIGGEANRAGRIALSMVMMATLAAFARSGDPSEALPGIAWPHWPKKMLFDASLTAAVITAE